MKIFISWSGDQSRSLAEALHRWLPAVIQAAKPYYSPDDVAKGTRWSAEICKELEASRIGLICLTRDNLVSPWIMFEAGALSKNLDQSMVCPILFGLQPSDIKGPLVQFQSCRFDRDDMERVVRMINAELGDQALGATVLQSVFDMWWPRLEEEVNSILEQEQAPHVSRSDHDILEEILALVRSFNAYQREPGVTAALRDLGEGYQAMLAAAGSDNASSETRTAFGALRPPVRNFSARSGSRTRVIERDEHLKIRNHDSPAAAEDEQYTTLARAVGHKERGA